MTKQDLLDKGLTEEQAKFVMDSLDGDFVTKSRFNEVNEENKSLKKAAGDHAQQLEDLKKSNGDNAALQQQITDLQQANADMQKAHDAEIAQLKLTNAIEAALMSAGAKNVKAARSLLDDSKLKLEDDGKVSGLEDQINAIKKSDGYMFADKAPAPKFKGFQPGASGTVPPGNEVDTSKMTYSEMVAYLDANPDAKI